MKEHFDQIKDTQLELSILSATIHYSYTKETSYLKKVKKVVCQNFPLYIEKLALSSGKIDKNSYKKDLDTCLNCIKTIANNIENIKIDFIEAKDKNSSCIDSVGIIESSDIPLFKQYSLSEQNLSYNFTLATYVNCYTYYKNYYDSKNNDFLLILANLKQIKEIAENISNKKGFLEANKQIVTSILEDIDDILNSYEKYKQINLRINQIYKTNVQNVLNSNTGSLRKIA